MSIDEELAAALPVQPGMVLCGKYRVERLLAAGGMGAVLVAHHEILDKRVAIKLVRPELVSRKEVAQRFMREARAAAKISSDYVARVTDVELLPDKTPFMVMDFLEGEDLGQLLDQKGRLPLTMGIDLALQALVGLDAAHLQGVVHRDLKPSNLFLERRSDGSRRVKLLDFGISKVMEGEDSSLKAGATTDSGQMLGTPRYMSPEQISDAKSVDSRTDLWAMGLITYEMLTGHYPFDGPSSGTILANILTRHAQPLHELCPDAPIELERALSMALAKDRNHRFSSAREMLLALAPFASRRMQAIADELREVADQNAETQRGAEVAAARTPIDEGPGATVPTKLHPKVPELGATVPVVAPSAAPDSTPTRLSSHGSLLPVEKMRLHVEEAQARARIASSTESSMVSDSKPSRRSNWKLGVIAAATIAASLAVYSMMRGPEATPKVTASPTASSAPHEAPAQTPAVTPDLGATQSAVVGVASSDPEPPKPEASASSVASVRATPRPKQTAPATTTATSGLNRTRD